MQSVQQLYRGLSLLMRLNWDRILSAYMILGALIVGAWIGTL